MRSAETELQNARELRAMASEIVAPKPGSRRQSEKKTILKHFLKGFLEGKSLAPKWRKKRISCETSFKTPLATHPPAPLAIPFTLRERSYSCKSQWNSVDRTCTKNTWNPIYNAEPIRPWSDHGPRMILPHTRPSRTRRTAEVDHRRSGTHFVWKNTGFRASAISQKRISCETSFKTPSATPPPAPLAIPFTLRERSYSCKSQWNSVDRTCTKNTWNPIYNAEPIRPWSDHGPRMIRPHTRPSRTRRTAEVDHRRSGTHFVWKNTGFRASAISQKRISCETSFKTPSATHPPAPLAIPFTLRERSYSCKSQWNSIGNSSTSTTCNPIYIAGTILQLQITMEFCRPQMHETQVKPHLQCGTDPNMIRAWSENDPTTHETVSQPSHRRGRSSRFGDGLCMEKHRVSCICYLSKAHSVRDFLQNSIGNSSTSTTCNPIYSERTILELRNSVDRKCTKHRWNPIYNAEPIRPWSEHDPNMIRPHTRPSRNRRTAEVDHRGSGTDFVRKNIGFCASAISQKRISCETSFKTPSATPPPAPLAIPFTVRERS